FDSGSYLLGDLVTQLRAAPDIGEEFLASISSGHVSAADYFPDDMADVPDGLAANQVAEAVVYTLEEVEVHHYDDDWGRVIELCKFLDFAVKLSKQAAP